MEATADNWGALVIADYEFILPIPYVIKKNQSILYQPFFSQQINVLGNVLPTVDLINQFISSIPKKFQLAQFNLPNYLIQNANGYEIEEVVFQYLDLNKGYDAIASEYSTNAKRQIKKAVKKELKIVEQNDLGLFMKMFKDTVGNKLSFTEGNYHCLQNLMDIGLANNTGRLVSTELDGETVAIGYFFIQENRITYLKGASTVEGKDSGGMYYLLDAIIQEYSNSRRIFDFGGSKVSSIAEFYKKLGGKDQTYLSFSKNDLPWLVKKAKGVRDRLKK